MMTDGGHRTGAIPRPSGGGELLSESGREPGPVRQAPLADQVLDLLTQRIARGFYPPNSRLPGEIELASELSVSRATVRRAMDLLVARGVVQRRQGIGTFVAPPHDIPNPLQQFIDFRDIIHDAGLEPGLVHLGAWLEEVDPRLAGILEVSPGDKALTVKKVFTADEEPVVYCLNHIPAWVLEHIEPKNAVLAPNYTEPILEFFKDKCGQRLDYYVSSVRSEIAEDCGFPEIMRTYEPRTAILVVDETGYNLDDRPVHHSIEFHPANRMSFKLIRLVGATDWNGQSRARERAFRRSDQTQEPRIIFRA
jgi:GntR family transcriptional regulator